jgi:hypothetical protein
LDIAPKPFKFGETFVESDSFSLAWFNYAACMVFGSDALSYNIVVSMSWYLNWLLEDAQVAAWDTLMQYHYNMMRQRDVHVSKWHNWYNSLNIVAYQKLVCRRDVFMAPPKAAAAKAVVRAPVTMVGPKLGGSTNDPRRI